MLVLVDFHLKFALDVSSAGILTLEAAMSSHTPTDRELEALKVLWNRGEATVREICDAINEGGDNLAYTTVLSLLQVMEQKGLVSHRRLGKAYVYRSNVEQERTIRSLATTFLDKVFDGATEQFLLHAIQPERLSSAELEQIEQMIARAKERRQDSDIQDGKYKKGRTP